jgi:hypothetical protein
VRSLKVEQAFITNTNNGIKNTYVKTYVPYVAMW